MSGAVFADAGSLFGAASWRKIVATVRSRCSGERHSRLPRRQQLDPLSVGASMMWNSPVGPLRMDYRQGADEGDLRPEQLFRFGASTKF